MTRSTSPGPSFDDLASTLVWPTLLRAPRLALRPARIGMSAVLLIIVALIAQLPAVWLDGASPARAATDLGKQGVSDVALGLTEFRPARIVQGLHTLFVAAPMGTARLLPWSTAAVALPVLLAWGVFGGAMSRMAATELSLRRRMPWTAGLSFGLSKWGSFLSCHVAPIATILVVTGVLAAGGWLLLSWNYVNVVGGVAYGLGVLLAAAAVLLAAGFMLGLPMLIPAVACEGSDAIDGIQRTLAYVAGRPLRLALYLLLLVVQFALVLWTITVIAEATVTVAARASTALLGDADAAYYIERAGQIDSAAAASGTREAAGSLIAFWSAIPALLVSSYVVSYWFCAGTVLYLSMRRVCDAQDVEELWTPDRPEGTLPMPAAADVGDDDDE